MKAPTVEDLTKSELIDLLRQHLVSISPHDIARIIYWRRHNAALAKMKEASADAQKYTGGTDLATHQKWLAAHARWGKAAGDLEKIEAWYKETKSMLATKQETSNE